MCTLQAYLQCYDGFSEVISNEVEYNELILENVVSQFLLGFFDEVMVDVNIIFSPHLQMELQHYFVLIQAQCSNQIIPSLSDRRDDIELHVEIKICSLLMELFGFVIVDDVTYIPSSRGYTYAHSSAGSV
jgi:hypothetical protein